MIKDVKGYDGYEIDDLGNVYSKERVVKYSTGKAHTHKRKLLKPLNKLGYNYIVFSVKGVVKHEPIHRLAAIAFLSNQKGKSQINHINGVKNDNNIKNIEWCDASENMIHSYRVLKNIHWMKGKFKRPERECKCGNNFQPTKDTSKFCSKSCATKYQSRFEKLDKTTLK